MLYVFVGKSRERPVQLTVFRSQELEIKLNK